MSKYSEYPYQIIVLNILPEIWTAFFFVIQGGLSLQ